MNKIVNPPAEEAFWQLSVVDAFKQFSSGEKGLTDMEAKKRLTLYGPNTIKTIAHSSGILFFSQFKSPITIMLIVAALLSAALGGCC